MILCYHLLIEMFELQLVCNLHILLNLFNDSVCNDRIGIGYFPSHPPPSLHTPLMLSKTSLVVFAVAPTAAVTVPVILLVRHLSAL
jgi:hypothetical protein